MRQNRRNFIRNMAATTALVGISRNIWANDELRLDKSIIQQDTTLYSDSWLKINGNVYGAKPDDTGSLGGGLNYKKGITKGDYEPSNLDELIEVLSKAKSGEVVFIPEEQLIDLTTYIYIDQFVLEIPAGVTLAGNRGHEGSEGAILTSDALNTPVMIKILGPNVRITGLRIQGPNPKRYMDHHHKSFQPGGPRHEYYYKFPTSRGIHTDFDHLEVDNCEITAFGQAGIGLNQGENHHIHHNFIHHCQYNGLGYGISLNEAASLIEYNLFNSNRHSIAGTGRPGCSYTARHNMELGVSLSHCFDMHGGKDRKDESIIAGTDIQIHNNTFRASEFAIGIRGEPENECKIFRNWFVSHEVTDEAIRPYPYEKREVYDNIYGDHPEHSK